MVVENLDVRGEGTFKRESAPQIESQSGAPVAASDDFAGYNRSLIGTGTERPLIAAFLVFLIFSKLLFNSLSLFVAKKHRGQRSVLLDLTAIHDFRRALPPDP